MKNFVFSIILLLVLLVAPINAATIFAGSPDIVIDSVSVSTTHPWIAQQVYAIPNSNWRLFFNDNKPLNPNDPPPYADYDFNDLVVDISFDGLNHGSASVIRVLSAYTNNTVRFYGNGPNVDLGNGDTGSLGGFLLNDPLKYRLLVNGSTGNGSNSQSFYYGGLNTMVQRLDPPSDVPEPGTYFMMGAGLLGLAGLKRRFHRN